MGRSLARRRWLGGSETVAEHSGFKGPFVHSVRNTVDRNERSQYHGNAQLLVRNSAG